MAKALEKTKENQSDEEKVKSKPKVSPEEEDKDATNVKDVPETNQEEKVKSDIPNFKSSTESTVEIPLELEAEKSSFLSKKLILIILALAIIVGLVGGGFMFLRARSTTTDTGEKPTTKPESQAETEKTKDAEASPTASTTEEANDEITEVDLADYTVQVLNGSGIAGEAGKVKDLLEAEGFDEIETDNASSYDYTDTEVSLKEDTPKQVFEAIKSALDVYTVIEGNILTEDAKYDVVVIVGQKKE